ncbi:This family is the oxydase domain of NRPS [Proteiniphilum saccharofermentans]|uniref:This family is the oxydase domain of NRPS n=1 Tax=Proteiniphilum saccharofermentans TaxID=1642647 RepID=A0A1R3T160_9BACT|nr:SagB/ThcOx family dehydrogenase [Proteiniphilum saccharofermentans]SCD19869.1 This family is the oxydase domain of NRPS [Proteiniphilum saccharofermentans]SEA50043.1 SagB-type dehydrogenase domain-containing protein [Porphyromonadaceae bacterium KH3R12]SFL54866.1 SagB-type dehydrogenase domain-containing protein [Porphyromonadaceae bacterium KH3CP3RA]
MTRFSILSLIFIMCCSISAQDINLPAPNKTGGKPLMQALNERKSTRSYQDKELTSQQLSDLLWAANGFNRDDKRTAPTANNRQELELYVTTKNGVYFYDARNHLLKEVKKGDQRAQAGTQDFVARAALNLIFVSDMEKASSREYAYTNCGFVAQNVYLYCASEGLGAVVRGSFDKDKLSELLKLNSNQQVLLTQSVGYPD